MLSDKNNVSINLAHDDDDEENLNHQTNVAPVLTNEYDKAITPMPRRIFILVSTLIETIIFSGLIFGWPAIFYMLKNEQIYSHLCPIQQPDNISSNNDTDDLPEKTIGSCIAQENILNLAFTIGIFAMGFTSFAWGFLLESKGLRFVRIALNILISLGCFLLATTTSEYSMEIIPAIIILGLVGVPLRIANMQIADFFPMKRSTIITFYSGAFSASPVIFVLIKYLYDEFDLNYFMSTFILFIISVTILPLNTFLLPKLSIRSREKVLKNRFDEYLMKINALDLELNKKKPHFVTKKLLKSVSERYAEMETRESLIFNENNNNKKPIIVNFTEFNQRRENQKKPGLFKSIFKPVKTDDNEIPLKVSLFSISFLMHQLWFSWINTYMVLYSGSMALWLDRVTKDKHSKSDFTQTFGLMQTSALVIAPLAGFIMDLIVRQANNVEDLSKKRMIQSQSGFAPILFTTLTLSSAVACRFFDTSQAVYVSIVFITLLRALFIAVASAYLRVRYPASHFNRLNGIMCTTGAFFSLLQFPLFYFESKSKQGAFWVNMFCAMMTLISLLNPLMLRINPLQRHFIRMEQMHTKRIQDSKQQQKQQKPN